MDNINPIPQNSSAAVAKGAALPTEKIPEANVQQVSPVKKAAESNLEAGKHTNKEQGRFEAVKQAAKSVNVFVVGDSRFTIYRDSFDGLYTTRVTSLRDGSVEIIKEPELFRTSGIKGAVIEASI